MNLHFDTLPTPLGPLTIACGDDLGIRSIFFGEAPVSAETTRADVWVRSPARVRLAADQVKAYLAGKPLPHAPVLNPAGTPFQQKVWATLRAIPYGQSRTYSDIAAAIGSAPRAVGGAVGANPIALLIPCHRVIASDGRLSGFAWGEERKIWLRKHEGLTPALPN